jgi:hypothetical protein
VGTLPLAFRITEWDDLIVDVHEKTTTIEVRILCTPPAESLGNTQLAATVSAAPLVAKFRRKSPPKNSVPKNIGETLPFPFRITQLDGLIEL